MALHQLEQAILLALKGRMGADELSRASGVPLSSVLSFSQSLKEKGLVQVSQEERRRMVPTSDGKRFAEQGLPEERVLAAAQKGAMVSTLQPDEKTIGLAWASRQGWVKIENGRLSLKNAPAGAYQLRQSLKELVSGKQVSEEQSSALEKRRLAEAITEKSVFISPTSHSHSSAAAKPSREINQLTREMLLSGSWKGAALREYDVSAPAEIPTPAKRHPVMRLRSRIAGIFADMGFEEMAGGETQPSFWNFDALFQPQDHPARDLADTFYVKGESALPKDKQLVAKVKAEHEKSWGGQWLEANAKKTVMRTHTTCLSARYLHEKCRDKLPHKFFAIGKVYRNEATDYKHLAEFFQVEGIVCWEGATFRDLLGCLKEFYKKLGFEKIRFQPSFFPYTEPSLEISVYFDKKKQWLELGGAGMLRPEVSLPLCGRYPVLAWGLSLERPLMLLNEMGDIRDFYRSNVGWIRKQKLG